MEVVSCLFISTRALLRTGLTVREHYVVAYADYLRSDPGLWRLTVDYLCTCGDIGKEMADVVLTCVPLRLDDTQADDGNRRDLFASVPSEETDTRPGDGDLSEVVHELGATCYQYAREPVRRTICRVSVYCKLRHLSPFSTKSIFHR